MVIIPNKMQSTTTVLLFFFMALLATPTLQQPTPSKPTNTGSFCVPESGNYTQGSAYQHDLNATLANLESNSSFSSFYATSTDTVFGRYFCRHDLSLRTCSLCVHTATIQIVADCPNYKEAVIWYRECTLLFLNSSSRLDTIDVASPYEMWYDRKNVTDPNKFYPVLEETMNRVINESAYGSGSEGFATAEAKVSAFERLYSLTQCSPDRSGLLCERCLRKALRNIDLCCSESADMEFYYPNCNLRYGVLQPFYDVPNPPPAGASPPPSVVASPGPPPVNESSNDSNQPTPSGNGAVARSRIYIFELGVAVMVLLFGN